MGRESELETRVSVDVQLEVGGLGMTSSVAPKLEVKKKSFSPLQLAIRRFRRNRLGVVGFWILVVLYTLTVFAGFFSPYAIETQHFEAPFQPPQGVYIVHDGQLRLPFTYPMTVTRDPVTFQKLYTENRDTPEPIRLFQRGEEYRLLGVFKTDVHLFGVQNGYFFPLGTDKLGRCLLSRMIVGSQVSLTVGLIGIIISFSIGIFMGGISGYYGGTVDLVIQRLVEVLLSFPRLPILLALSYVIPATWPSTYVYLGIVAVLSLLGWAGLARVVRGQVLSAKALDYTQAAKALGASDLRIILRHIVPNLTSYLIITASLAIPGYILGESALSFLGLGVKEPMTSWGILLSSVREEGFSALNQYPWLLAPGLMIVLSVLAFNFCGDALRDAADTQTRN
jgi:peptide/nickel transport system permease protein